MFDISVTHFIAFICFLVYLCILYHIKEILNKNHEEIDTVLCQLKFLMATLGLNKSRRAQPWK